MLCRKVGEEFPSRHKAGEQLGIRGSRSASPSSSASTSRCGDSCRAQYQCLVGRTGQVRGGVSGITPPGAGESGGAGSGCASGEGHAHHDKKYGRFPLDRRINVDQVRTRVEYIRSIYLICNNIRCIALIPYAVCGLLELTTRDLCCYRRISDPMALRSHVFHVFVGAATVRQRLDQRGGRQREQARPHLSTVFWPREAAVPSATVLRSWQKIVQIRCDLPWYRKADQCS